ncbi:MAG: Exosortase/archaeosortase family protein [Acidimicrobiales bacterium]|nr:Exosortase/archaeosortase family protein [Acidimicrobiales bacterium]
MAAWSPAAWRPTVTPEGRAAARTARMTAICLAAIVLAYHYSFTTLVRTLSVETPLAYLGLVPAISLVLIARRSRLARFEPPIHDRQVDWIVGLPLLLASVMMSVLLPVQMSSMFWVWRVDLLTLPVFVAGVITLLFGVRTLWRFRLPIAFLLLAWPVPYTRVLLHQLDAFTGLTLVGVRLALRVVPVAHVIPRSDGSLFQIPFGSKGFPVSVASACSGANGVVGYALVGGAFLTEVRGRRLLKVLWLLVGMALIWVLNVLRIIAIFAAGRQWGQAVAIDALHPVLGLVLFNVGVLAMFLLLGRFRLSLAAHDAASEGSAPRPEPGFVPPAAVPRTRLAVSVVVAIGLLSGVANSSLRDFDRVANLDGSPRISSFIVRPARPLGWRATKVAQYTWAKRFFGGSSDWWRFDYSWDGRTHSPFSTRTHIVADVISTGDASTLATYGVEACYQFHGYRVRSVRTVDLKGVLATVISYYNSSIHADWTSVSWNWPVATPHGVRFERVTLMINSAAHTKLTAQVPTAPAGRQFGLQLQNALRGRRTSPVDAHMAKTQNYLIAFAAELVKRAPVMPTHVA